MQFRAGKRDEESCKHPCDPPCANPKSCKNNHCQGCRQKCYENISESQRLKVFKQYWALDSQEKKWNFVRSSIKVFSTQRSRKRNSDSVVERATVVKRFIDGVQVCSTMFENTLCISRQIVKTVLSKMDEYGVIEPDQRGKTGQKPSLKRDVIEHIKLFPVRDTHYCHSGTNRRWLHEDLSLPKMHELYKLWCKENVREVAPLKFYRMIFNKEFNLSFHSRKKDKCNVCDHFDDTDVVSKARKRVVFKERKEWNEMSYNEVMDVQLEEIRA